MNRREFLGAAIAAGARAASTNPAMGIATTCYMTVWRPRDTVEFLEHGHSIAAGGIQSALSSTDPVYIKKLRDRATEYGMYFEAMSGLPKEDTTQFEATLKGAKEAGALLVRSACLSGRRYENFPTLESWREFVSNSRAAIARALPIAEKHKIRLVLENHKDWTLEEMVPLLKSYSSEYLGCCLDTGNNISLLDDPMEVIEALAPWAYSTHIKDMGVEPYDDGFLLSEVPLGDGFLDVPKIVAIIRKHQPKTRLTLEMITRDPLKVPCLTDKYWAPFPDRNGRYLAKTMRMVKANAKAPLPKLATVAKENQRQVEADNVTKCLQWAKTNLA